MKDVNLSMVPTANVGDYVLVHVGVAIGIVDEEEANKTFEYIRQIGELNELNIDGVSAPDLNKSPQS